MRAGRVDDQRVFAISGTILSPSRHVARFPPNHRARRVSNTSPIDHDTLGTLIRNEYTLSCPFADLFVSCVPTSPKPPASTVN